jgi:hypothetical protein
MSRVIPPGARRAVALFAFTIPLAALAAPPVPEVTGPIPATEASYPFGAADHQLKPQNLKKYGYVEEEYFASGAANIYTWPAPGPAVVRTADTPYTTRMLVRRPAKDAQFSGNVIVELLNPSNLFDLNIGWALMHRQMVQNGDAWIGVTIKPVSIDALQNFDQDRYQSLSMANPLPLDDPQNCEVSGSDTRDTERGLVWDMFTQVGAWVRSGDASNPFANTLQQVYGFGYSQTGGYLYNYINGIQPLVEADDGRSVYDGYIVAVAGGRFVGAVPMNQCEPAPPLQDPRRQFRDVGVPIIHVMSESDYLIGIDSRREDSDSLLDPFRHYEMAGAGHATPDELFFSAAPEDILKAGRSVPPLECNEGPRSRFPSHIHFDSMLNNLDVWVREQVPPPRAEWIKVVDGQPVRDEFENVVGGVRSPFVDVPTSTWFGSATGASFCFIAGWERPFDETTLNTLYGNHGGYVRRVVSSVRELVDQRFLTPRDGQELLRQAAKSDVPDLPSTGKGKTK